MPLTDKADSVSDAAAVTSVVTSTANGRPDEITSAGYGVYGYVCLCSLCSLCSLSVQCVSFPQVACSTSSVVAVSRYPLLIGPPPSIGLLAQGL